MRVTKFVHACLLVEKGPDRILIDPGTFSFRDERVTVERFDGVKAVFLTHSHVDHVDAGKLRALVERSRPEVYAPPDLATKLSAEGIEARAFDAGSRRVGSFEIRAIAAPHERVLGLELPQNVAYVVDERLLHPGDSHATSLNECGGIPLLALPLVAPWTTDLATAAFAERLAPRRAMPIHDGYVKEFVLGAIQERIGAHLRGRGIGWEPALEPGASVEV